jgi:vancomycin resistance protein VanJ
MPQIIREISWRIIFCVFLLLFWISLVLCYTLQPDSAAAVTLFPAWIWAGIGIVATLLLLFRAKRPLERRLVGAGLALWALFLGIFAEELRSSWRMLLPATKGDIRVITLNCAGGDPRAAEEVIAYKPDIVLLSEAPKDEHLAPLCEKLYGTAGGFASGFDCAVLARGKVRTAPMTTRERGPLALAFVTLPGTQKEIACATLRLPPPVFRYDLWNPDCWSAQQENRAVRRAKLVEVLATLQKYVPSEMPLILAGDWNAPQGDAIYRLLPHTLSDAFTQAGRGWGNTAINEIPVLRIDQIWASVFFQPTRVEAFTTQNSDHRLVLAEFLEVH